MDINDYRNQIDRAIRERDDEVILNGSHAHATVIVERMFSHANESVQILTRKFDPRIYGTMETIEEAKLCLGDTSRKCRIIIEELDPAAFDNHPFLRELSPFIESGNLEIRQMPKGLADMIVVNFSTLDNYGFRFEEDKKEAVAVASFGPAAESFVGRLKTLFDLIWSRSPALQPDAEALPA